LAGLFTKKLREKPSPHGTHPRRARLLSSGRARAKKLRPEERWEIARKAAEARWRSRDTT
jgi:hypothetical protein